jgi:hypothetical protein
MENLLPLHPRPDAWLRKSDLAPFVPAYRRYLAERRYAPGTQRAYLGCVAHFARWFTSRRRAVGSLTGEDVRRFLDEHLPVCTCPAPVHRSRHVLRGALHHLEIVLHDMRVVDRPTNADPVEDELLRSPARHPPALPAGSMIM